MMMCMMMCMTHMQEPDGLLAKEVSGVSEISDPSSLNSTAFGISRISRRSAVHQV